MHGNNLGIAVDISQDQRYRVVIPVGPGQFQFKGIVELAPVIQLGQAVAGRDILEIPGAIFEDGYLGID